MAARNRIIPVFVPHSGCPNDCVFCNQRRISGVTVPPSGADVKEIIESAISKGITGAEVAFYGGSFTAIPRDYQEELFSAAEPFLRLGAVSSIRISTRPDCIDEDILSFLEENGVKTIELGAQSMNNDVLACSGRGHTAEATVNASKLIKSRGFTLILQLMCGLPGDTREISRDTVRRIIELSPDGTRIYPVVVIEGTVLADMMRSGEYKALTVDEAADYAADMLEELEKAGIPALRVGLNPSEELHASVAAGPYHPAFGEIARGRVIYRRFEKLLDKAPTGVSKAVLYIPQRELSAAIGIKRENLMRLKGQYPGLDVLVKPGDALCAEFS